MKRLLSTITSIILFYSCHQKDTSYKSHWTQLTNRDGKRVVMQPSDVDLREIDVSDSILHIVYPTEYNRQLIKSVEKQSEGFAIVAGATLYRMRWIQKDSGVAAWISYATPERPDSFVYVDSLHVRLFERMQQPATECK